MENSNVIAEWILIRDMVPEKCAEVPEEVISKAFELSRSIPKSLTLKVWIADLLAFSSPKDGKDELLESERILSEVLQDDPLNPDAYLSLSAIQSLAEKNEEATVSSELASTLNGEVNALLTYAEALVELGKEVDVDAAQKLVNEIRRKLKWLTARADAVIEELEPKSHQG
jgi:predicted Zn-dependent protease